MKRLIVLAGKPGVGKTTLIKSAFRNLPNLDVLPFVEEYRNPDGSIQEENLIQAYRKMYEQLFVMDEPKIVLEIGTNYPEFNIKMLGQLSARRDIFIYLCQASNETCLKRANERGMRHNDEAFKRRLARDFPNTHLILLTKTALPHRLLDMEQPLENLISFVTRDLADIDKN